MDERNMMRKIAESAQDIKAPDALSPRQMEQKLKKLRQKRQRFYKMAAAAACLCLCFGAGSYAYATGGNADNNRNMSGAGIGQAENAEDGAAKAAGKSKQDTDNGAAQKEPLKKVGRMYTLAANYGDVYDVLKKGIEENTRTYFEYDKGAEAATNNGAATDSAAPAEKQKMDDSQEKPGSTDYSKTNLQVENVDESDIVKTDGSYIYVVQDGQIQILDIRKKVPKKAAVVLPDMDEGADAIREMYVADGILTLIIQTETTDMRAEEPQEEDPQAQQAKKESAVSDLAMIDDIYRIDTSAVTKAVTYDIKNPEAPVLKDTATQDGWYQDSRKIGNRLYLFTNQTLELPDGLARKEAVTEEKLKDWIPRVNSRAIGAESIYLPKAGNQGMIVSCFDLANHNQALDTKMLVNAYAQLYMTQNSVYLYYTDYAGDALKTRIARFALETDGTIRARAAATLKGSIEDTFAIHEKGSYLQALTSVTSAEPWENRVYVLDENMKTVGKLTGLAMGERIYSARFTGDIGYFVTYRNTDPLFTVDFSNPKEPKIIGELKVTGFSDYLQFWSDGRLLGIGRETDPETGNIIGVKLSMFNISNPAKVKEEGKLVLKDVNDSEAMYNYKSVLADSRKNIIALTTEQWDDEYQRDYRVFSYQKGTFTSNLEYTLDLSYSQSGSWRSVYVDNILYLVGGKKTVAFDMKDEFKKIGKVKY